VHGERGQDRLPRVVADEDGHPSERGVERAHALAGLEHPCVLERRVVHEGDLPMDVQRRPVLDVDGAVVPQVAVALVEADERSGPIRECCSGRRGAGCVAPDPPYGVAAQLHLGEDDEVGARGVSVGDRLPGPARVGVELSQPGVDLGERDSHAPHDTRAVAYG